MSEFFHMSGYAAHVWSCYGLALAVLAGNLWSARRALAAQIQHAKRRNTAAEQRS